MSTMMSRIYSNGPRRDYVINPFSGLIKASSRLYLAAPYFTYADPILQAAKDGKVVQLLVGLNAATNPEALRVVHNVSGVSVRYFTKRFHAKIYIFDDAALLGSSNLTDGGLVSNREAVICLDRLEDQDTIEEIRALFLELWEAGRVLTEDTLKKFVDAREATRRQGPDPDSEIERAVGNAEPPNINVASREMTRERIFLEALRQTVFEEYRPAFNEVTSILENHSLRRPELADLGVANETNRFLNWVRLTHVIGDEAWQTAPLRSPEERRAEIIQYGREWISAHNNRVPEDYAAWIKAVRRVFGAPDALQAASKDEITQGLMSLHAFTEQLRFVRGGATNLPTEFWRRNNNDIEHVKATLSHFLHGSGDFIQRLHDILYDASLKLSLFGQFCALELYGTIRPDECPPMNGRMAKALRFLGFNVKGV